MTETIPSPTTDDYSQWLEVAALTDFITQRGQGSSLSDFKLTDLYKYLQNPYANLSQIRKSSVYLTNKNGVVKETLRILKSIATLNYHLAWSNYDDVKKITKYEEKVFKFLEEINVKKLTRDILYETGEIGSVVPCLRNKKYVQFLEMDNIKINSMVNGKWRIQVDLKSIDKMRTIQDKLAIIESLPDEVTIAKYNLYKNKGEDYRYVDIKDAMIISPDASRSYPYSLPFSFGAWESLLQKEVINRVERSVANRIIKDIVILKFGTLDKDQTKPVPKELIQSYFKEVSNLLVKKEGMGRSGTSYDDSGTGTISVPHFLSLDTLKVNTELFKKELYEKINRDIFMNLGVSESLISGGAADSNFSSAQMNSEKLFRYLFTILEQVEYMINDFIKQLLPSNLSCKFYFDRVTMLDKDKHIEQCKSFYQQTGIFSPWAESLLGIPLHYALGQARYEKEVLRLEEYISPPENFFNQTSKSENGKSGRPSDNSPTNENTNKGRTGGNNNAPSPSD